MISKMLLSGAAANPQFSASITPSSFEGFSTGGSFTTPRFTLNLVGASSDYTYQWTLSGFNANDFNFVGSLTLDYCILNTSGFNTVKSADLTCTVTDTNTSATFEVSASVLITFEI